MASKKVDNSFTHLVGIKHPWEFDRKILEYEIQGVHYTWTPKDVLMNLKIISYINKVCTKVTVSIKLNVYSHAKLNVYSHAKWN
jgi:hypothetical protein